jgi:flagellar motor protein MotB
VIDDELEEPAEASPVWPAFGDLMACLFGLFVLFFVWAVAFQADLAENLSEEKQARAVESAQLSEQKARLEALEHVLAGPLADGTITLTDGKIGVRGSVLFALRSAELSPDGAALLSDLGGPLRAYLEEHHEAIMVSGFTDSSPIVSQAGGYKDNLELSAARATTVARALIAAGVPKQNIFVAGFGDAHPIAPNDTPDNRAKNRRVEIAPMPIQVSPGIEAAPSSGATPAPSDP